MPLFDGKSLTGWSIDGDDKSGWSVDDGVIFARGVNGKTRNYLLTDREYSDYVLRLEFSLEKGALAGIAVRAIPGENVPQQNGSRSFDHPAVKLFESSGTTSADRHDVLGARRRTYRAEHPGDDAVRRFVESDGDFGSRESNPRVGERIADR